MQRSSSRIPYSSPELSYSTACLKNRPDALPGLPEDVSGELRHGIILGSHARSRPARRPGEVGSTRWCFSGYCTPLSLDNGVSEHRSVSTHVETKTADKNYNQDFVSTFGGFISTISSVPLNSIPLLPLHHFRSPQSFPPTYQRRHQRNRSLTCNILRNQEEHRRTSL